MQWLIDVIAAWISEHVGYFDRGDPASFDFQVGDFIQDNSWRDLDLSAIVPVGTKGVHLHVVINSLAPAIVLNFRTNGNTDVFNVTRTACFISNVRNSVDVIVSPDSSRIIEYKIFGGTFSTLNVCVAGWWLR